MIGLTLFRMGDFFRRTAPQRRPASGCLATSVCLALLVAACNTAPRPTAEPSREELANFQEVIGGDINQISKYISKTQDGKNLSELTLGWFIYDVLTELSSQDDELYDYFNNDDINLQVYLKTRFHDHPLDEIAALDRLAKQGRPTLRLSARYALETLRHIPNSDEPAETQSRDRRELADALTTLRDLLAKSAREAALPRP